MKQLMMKSYNMILKKKQQKYRQYDQVESMNMDISQV